MPVKWDAQADHVLLLKLLETHGFSVDAKKIADAWPENMPTPTPRAITERFVKIRADARKKIGGGDMPPMTLFKAKTNGGTGQDSSPVKASPNKRTPQTPRAPRLSNRTAANSKSMAASAGEPPDAGSGPLLTPTSMQGSISSIAACQEHDVAHSMGQLNSIIKQERMDEAFNDPQTPTNPASGTLEKRANGVRTPLTNGTGTGKGTKRPTKSRPTHRDPIDDDDESASDGGDAEDTSASDGPSPTKLARVDRSALRRRASAHPTRTVVPDTLAQALSLQAEADGAGLDGHFGVGGGAGTGAGLGPGIGEGHDAGAEESMGFGTMAGLGGAAGALKAGRYSFLGEYGGLDTDESDFGGGDDDDGTEDEYRPGHSEREKGEISGLDRRVGGRLSAIRGFGDSSDTLRYCGSLRPCASRLSYESLMNEPVP